MNIKNFSLFEVEVTLEHLIMVTGLGILCYWLAKTRFGKKSLADSKPRRNNMPLAIPFILWVTWVTLLAIGSLITNWLGEHGGMTDWQKDLISYIAMGSLEVIMIPAMLIAARMFFARRLKGFGLEIQTLPGDLSAAFINLWAILPVVLGFMWLVVWLGQFFRGDQFEMQLNEGLKTILDSDQTSVKIIIFFVAVVIAPVCEEILFRGLLQTSIRKITTNPWPGILLTSIFFAMMHPWMHWPALFILSTCLGYAYEKSGSLYRPIFIHMLFNLINILAALSQQAINKLN